MDASEKKKLLDYSNSAKGRQNVFRGIVPMGIEMPLRWDENRLMPWLMRDQRGRSMAREACEHGWHMRLWDFVSYQHRLPNDDEIERLVLQAQLIASCNLPPQCKTNSDRIKSLLSGPVEARGEF